MRDPVRVSAGDLALRFGHSAACWQGRCRRWVEVGLAVHGVGDVFTVDGLRSNLDVEGIEVEYWRRVRRVKVAKMLMETNC